MDKLTFGKIIDSSRKKTKNDVDKHIEGFQYVASKAWSKITGKNHFDFPLYPKTLVVNLGKKS